MEQDFHCVRCGNCCRWHGYVRVDAGEIDAIAAFLGIPTDEFIAKHTRLTGDRSGLSLLENEDGSCPYLTMTAAGAACELQAVKPHQCRNFPEKWNFPGWENECKGASKHKVVTMAEIQRLGSAIIISGPSGVGKSTVCGRVREAFPELQFSVSCTTRQPRPGEVHGVHYYFLTHEEFEKRLALDEFIEHARVFDNFYGTLKSEVLSRVRNGEDVFLDIDVQGAMQIREAAKRDAELAKVCAFLLLAPPDLPTLEKRLRGRASDSEEQITMRLAKAKQELAFYPKYDYLVINDELENAVESVKAIIRSVRLQSAKAPEGLFQ